ncbi:MAG: DUF1573 domain-containing protein [Rikenellaceae bacterium]
MIACGGGNNKSANTEVKVEQKVLEENITTFEMPFITDSTEKLQIGSRSIGKARSGEQLSDRFAVKNSTGKPLVILEAKSNCGCLTVDYSKEPMKVGDVKRLNYSYDSRGKIGQQLSEVTIKTNHGDYFVLIDLLIE